MTQAEIIGVIADHHRWYPALQHVEMLVQVVLFAMFALLQIRLRRVAVASRRQDFLFQQPQIRRLVRRMGITVAVTFSLFIALSALQWRIDGESKAAIADISRDAESRVYAAEAKVRHSVAVEPAAPVAVAGPAPAATREATAVTASAQTVEPQSQPQQVEAQLAHARVQVAGASGVVLRDRPSGAALKLVPNGAAIDLADTTAVTSESRAWVHVRLADLSSGWVVASAVQKL